MALLGIRRDPSPRELRWFGVVTWPLFLVAGALLWLRSGRPVAAAVVAGAGTGLVLVYYALPPVRRFCYVGWMTAFHPVGWLLSHALLVAVYYLVLTPIGWVRRRADPLEQRREPGRESYWLPRPPAPPPDRYFRQF